MHCHRNHPQCAGSENDQKAGLDLVNAFALLGKIFDQAIREEAEHDRRKDHINQSSELYVADRAARPVVRRSQDDSSVCGRMNDVHGKEEPVRSAEDQNVREEQLHCHIRCCVGVLR